MRRVLAIFAVLAAACADQPPELENPEAGLPEEEPVFHRPASAPIPDPAEALPAASPIMTPCPANWPEVQVVRRDGTAITACEPLPHGEKDCELDEAQFPGDSECHLIGRPCPSGDWPDQIPGSRVLYVRPGGTGPENGTREEPYRTISAAINAGGIGAVTIALAKGTYTGTYNLPRNLTLTGACVAETVLTASDFGIERGIVNALFPFVEVNNVRIRGSRPGVWAHGGEITVRDVVIESARGGGMQATAGGKITARNVSINGVVPDSAGDLAAGALSYGGFLDFDRAMFRNIRGNSVHAQELDGGVVMKNVLFREHLGRPHSPQLGRALHIVHGGQVTIIDSVATHTQDSAINIAGETSRLTLQNVVLRDVDGLSENTGSAIQVALGAKVTSSRLWVERALNGSLHAETGGILELADLIVTDVGPDPETRRYGRHVNILTGGHVSLHRAYFARALEIGIFVHSATATLSLTDVRVEEMLGSALDGRGGAGVTVQDGATSTITRLHIEGARNVGLLANEGFIEAEDVVVQEMGSQRSDGTLGVGIAAQDGGEIRLKRALVDRARYYGVAASAGLLEVSDLRVRETLPAEVVDGTALAIGVAGTSTGGMVIIERARLENNGVAGMGAALSGVVRATDIVIRDNRGEEGSGFYGEGVLTENLARLELRHARIEAVREFGVYANLGSTVLLDDVTVRDTEGNPEGVGGYGLYVRGKASAEVDNATFDNNRVFGVMTEGEGSNVRLRNVEVLRTRPTGPGAFLVIEGTGIAARDGAYLSAEHFNIDGNPLCGVSVKDAEMDLSHGDVTGCRTGANVETVAGFDVERLQNKVRYDAEEQNLDSKTLPVPKLELPDSIFPDED